MCDHSAQNEERDRDRGEGEREEGREIGERELGKGWDKMRNMFNIQTI